jgi:hypothetical protein
MNHITPEQVEAILHKLAPVREPEFWTALCNAAIQHYIDSKASEDFCYCHDGVSLQMVSGGGAPDGYLGKVTLRIGDQYRDFYTHHQASEPEPSTAGERAVQPMTAHRAAYFMERFKRAEKLLGPNEQAAVDYVLALLQSPALPVGEMTADMFWNHDDAEQLYSSIEEFLNDEICNGAPLEVGHTRTIQRAVRLPNIEIRVTSIDEESCEAEYEVVQAASGITQGEKA